MDLWHAVTNWVDRNRGVAFGLLLSVLACLCLVGCPITTTSLRDPGQKVTVAELEAEDIALTAGLEKRKVGIEADLASYNVDVHAHNAKVEAANADIERKAEWRAKIVETIGGIGTAAATGTLTPEAGVAAVIQLTTLFSALGLAYDNRRKDKVITAKSAAAESPSTG